MLFSRSSKLEETTKRAAKGSVISGKKKTMRHSPENGIQCRYKETSVIASQLPIDSRSNLGTREAALKPVVRTRSLSREAWPIFQNRNCIFHPALTVSRSPEWSTLSLVLSRPPPPPSSAFVFPPSVAAVASAATWPGRQASIFMRNKVQLNSTRCQPRGGH